VSALHIRYNIEKLSGIINDLTSVTGLSMAFMDCKNNYLYSKTKPQDSICIREQSTKEGRALCNRDDLALIRKCIEAGGAVSHVCHAGLTDTAVPIFKKGITVGYVIIGRILTESFGALPPQGMSHFTDEQLTSIKNLVSHIVFESAIDIDYDSVASRAKDYIEDNLSSDLTVDGICSALFISKNKLYESFHDDLGSTVSEYITERRISRAKELLAGGDEPIIRIAEAVGIPNYTYFSRLFKKVTGSSPKSYRKDAKAAQSPR